MKNPDADLAAGGSKKPKTGRGDMQIASKGKGNTVKKSVKQTHKEAKAEVVNIPDVPTIKGAAPNTEPITVSPPKKQKILSTSIIPGPSRAEEKQKTLSVTIIPGPTKKYEDEEPAASTPSNPPNPPNPPPAAEKVKTSKGKSAKGDPNSPTHISVVALITTMKQAVQEEK